MRTNRRQRILLITLVSITVIVSGYVFVRVGPVLFEDLPRVQPNTPVPVASGMRSTLGANSLDYLEPIKVPEKPANDDKPKDNSTPPKVAAAQDKKSEFKRHHDSKRRKHHWHHFKYDKESIERIRRMLRSYHDS